MPTRHFTIGLVELDENGVTTEAIGHKAGRPGAAKRVKDGPGGHPAKIHGSTSFVGKVAKCTSETVQSISPKRSPVARDCLSGRTRSYPLRPRGHRGRAE